MPKCTGVEAATRLRSDPRFDRTAIVILSASSPADSFPLDSPAPYDAWIGKPFALEELKRELLDHVACRRAG
jgi:CheY-like chemotaxis protein